MKLSLQSLQTSLQMSLKNSLTLEQRPDAIARRTCRWGTARWGTALLGMMAIASCAHITPTLSAQEANNPAGRGPSLEPGHSQSVTAQSVTAQHAGSTDHRDHSNHKMKRGMKHAPLMIPQGQPVPTLNLTVKADAMRGWNLQAAVSNFSFAPERVNQRSLTTEGHAHLFINGEKITRLYGPWYYIPELPPGEHEIRVELNANGHETLITGGEAIADTVKITVPSN
ncbi:MAG: hypothetical protein HC771_07270 [Synechococcales cyanobacterium CRU_2_2]|nr:hypothetical protein [Synechococcales cyanobacterium CRU_2_2]